MKRATSARYGHTARAHSGQDHANAPKSSGKSRSHADVLSMSMDATGGDPGSRLSSLLSRERALRTQLLTKSLDRGLLDESMEMRDQDSDTFESNDRFDIPSDDRKQAGKENKFAKMASVPSLVQPLGNKVFRTESLGRFGIPSKVPDETTVDDILKAYEALTERTNAILQSRSTSEVMRLVEENSECGSLSIATHQLWVVPPNSTDEYPSSSSCSLRTMRPGGDLPIPVVMSSALSRSVLEMLSSRSSFNVYAKDDSWNELENSLGLQIPETSCIKVSKVALSSCSTFKAVVFTVLVKPKTDANRLVVVSNARQQLACRSIGDLCVASGYALHAIFEQEKLTHSLRDLHRCEVQARRSDLLTCISKDITSASSAVELLIAVSKGLLKVFHGSFGGCIMVESKWRKSHRKRPHDGHAGACKAAVSYLRTSQPATISTEVSSEDKYMRFLEGLYTGPSSEPSVRRMSTTDLHSLGFLRYNMTSDEEVHSVVKHDVDQTLDGGLQPGVVASLPRVDSVFGVPLVHTESQISTAHVSIDTSERLQTVLVFPVSIPAEDNLSSAQLEPTEICLVVSLPDDHTSAAEPTVDDAVFALMDSISRVASQQLRTLHAKQQQDRVIELLSVPRLLHACHRETQRQAADGFGAAAVSSLEVFLRTAQSDQISKRLGARSTHMLACSHYLGSTMDGRASVGSTETLHESTNQAKLLNLGGFYGLPFAGGSLESPPMLDIPLSSALHGELMKGYATLLKRTMFAADDPKNSRAGLSGQPASEGHAAAFDDGYERIWSYISAADSSVQSAVVVPVRSAVGLNLLILVDKIDEVTDGTKAHGTQLLRRQSSYMSYSSAASGEGRAVNTVADNNRIGYTDADVATINACNVAEDLANAMNALIADAQGLRTSEGPGGPRSSIVVSTAEHRCKVSQELLAERLKLTIAKEGIRECFSKWSHAASLRRQEKAFAAKGNLLRYMVDLLALKLEPETYELKTFLNVVERYTSKLFPRDLIAISQTRGVFDVDGGSASVAPNEIKDHDDFDDDDGHSTRKSLVGNISNYRHASIDGTTGSLCLAEVKLVRASDRNRQGSIAFSDAERDLFSQLCYMTSLVCTAYLGSTGPLYDGDAKEKVFPLLMESIPAIFEHLGASESAGKSPESVKYVEECLYGFVNTVKSLTGSHVALLSTEQSLLSFMTGTSTISSEDSRAEKFDGKLVLDERVHVSQAVSNDSDGRRDNNAEKLFLKVNEEGDAMPPVGNLRVMGREHALCRSQTDAVKLLLYVMSKVVRYNQHFAITQENMQAQAENNAALEGHVKMLTRQVELSQAHHTSAKDTVSAMCTMVNFLVKISQAIAPLELANLLEETLPALLGVRYATLYLTEASTSPLGEQIYRRIAHSKESDTSESITTEMLKDMDVYRLPSYTESNMRAPCKIMLTSSSSTDSKSQLESAVIGVIVLANTADALISLASESADGGKERLMSMGAMWQGYEAFVHTAISTSVASALCNCEIISSIQVIKSTVRDAETVVHERDRLVLNCKALQISNEKAESANSALVEEVASLQSAVTELTLEKEAVAANALEDIVALNRRKDVQCDKLRDEVGILQSEISQYIGQKELLLLEKASILDHVTRFVRECRGNDSSVLDWMHEQAAAHGAALHMIAQTEDSQLVGVSNDDLRGVVSAAGEALRTGLPAEIITTRMSDEVKILSGGDPQSGVIRSSSPDNRGNYGTHAPLAVLCVPNLCAPVSGSCKYACFVFVKEARSRTEGFTAAERDTLQCLGTLAGNVLLMNSRKYNANDYAIIENNLSQEVSRYRRFLDTLSVAKKLWASGCGDISDIMDIMVRGLRSLSARPNDTCVLECFVWLPPMSTSAKGVLRFTDVADWMRGSGALFEMVHAHNCAPEIEIVTKVISSKHPHRQRSLLWLPILNSEGEVIGLIRAERKLCTTGPATGPAVDAVVNAENASLPSLASSPPQERPSLSDLNISDVDQEVFQLFVSVSLPWLDRITYIAEAYDSIRSAGNAIVALQDVQARLQDQLAFEVSQRSEYEHVIKAGFKLIGLVDSQRMETVQIMDEARRCILNVTDSDECYILIPRIENSTHAEVSGGIEMAAAVGETQDLNTGVQPPVLFTIEEERMQPTRVALDFGDLEYDAIEKGIPLVSAPHSLEHDRTTGAANRRSWCLRRLMERKKLIGDASIPSLLDMCLLAMPILLPDQTWAVIVTLRGARPYTSVNRDCVHFLSRVFAHCLQERYAEYGKDLITALTSKLSKEREKVAMADSAVHEQRAEKEAMDTSIKALMDRVLEIDMSLEIEPKNVFKYFLASILGQNCRVEAVPATLVTPEVDGMFLSLKEQKVKIKAMTGCVEFLSCGDSTQSTQLSPLLRKLRGIFTSEKAFGESENNDDDDDDDGKHSFLPWLLVRMSQQGLPPTILAISIPTAQWDGLAPASLWTARGTFLLKILELYTYWSGRMFIAGEEMAAIKAKQKSLFDRFQEAKADQQATFDSLMETHKMEIATLRAKTKVSVKEQILLSKANEMHMIVGLTLLRDLRLAAARSSELLAGGPSNDGILNRVQQLLARVSTSYGSSLRCDVAVGAVHHDGGGPVHWLVHPSKSTGTAPPKQSITSRSDPIAVALASQRIVTICGQSEEVAIRKSLDHMMTLTYGAQLHESPMKQFLLRSSEEVSPVLYPPGTVIVPFPTDVSSSVGIVVVIKQPTELIEIGLTHELVQEPRFMSASVARTVWVWSILTLAMQQVDKDYDEKFALKSAATRALLRRVVQQSARKKDSVHMLKAFGKWRGLLAAFHVQAHQRCLRKVQKMEKCLADSTEISKGIIGASSTCLGRDGGCGVTDLWAAASPMLRTILSGSVSVIECGFIAPPGTRSSQERGDVATDDSQETCADVVVSSTGAVISRDSSVLGSRVNDLVVEIMQGKTDIRRRRILKLSRQDSSVSQQAPGHDEQLWLLPLRDATRVVGIVRVTVSVETNATSESDAAQGIATRFVEALVAPVLFASLAHSLKDELAKSEVGAVNARDSIASVIASQSLLKKVLQDVCVSIAGDKSSDSSAIVDWIVGASRRLSASVGHLVEIHLYESVLDAESSARLSAEQINLREGHDYSDSIIITEPLSLASRKDPAGRIGGSIRCYFKENASAGSAAFAGGMDTCRTVLNQLATITAVILNTKLRAHALRGKVNDSVKLIKEMNTLRSMEATEREKKFAELTNRIEHLGARNERYHYLLGALRDSFVCVLSRKQMVANLSQYLMRVSDSLLRIFGGKCLMAFGLNGSTVGGVTGADCVFAEPRPDNIIWYHDDSTVTTTARGYPFDGHLRSAVEGFARSSMMSHEESAVDAEQIVKSAPFEFKLSMKEKTLYTYPVVDTTADDCYGVLQVIGDSAGREHEDISCIAPMIASVLAIVLTDLVRKASIDRSAVDTEAKAILLENQVASADQQGAYWQKRAEMWHAVAMLMDTVGAKLASGETLSDLLDSESVCQCFSNAGIEAKLIHFPQAGAGAQITGSEVYHSYTHMNLIPVGKEQPLALTLSPLENAEMRDVIEFSTVQEEVTSTTTCILRAVWSLCLSRSNEVGTLQTRSSELVQNTDRLQHELQAVRADIERVTTSRAEVIDDLSDLTRRYDDLHATTTQSVRNICLPTIVQLAKSMKEIAGEKAFQTLMRGSFEGELAAKYPDAHSAPSRTTVSSDEKWNSLCRTVSSVLARVIGNVFRMHVSVITSEPVPPGEGRQGDERYYKVIFGSKSVPPSVYAVPSSPALPTSRSDACLLEMCFQSGRTEEVLGSTSVADLIGTNATELSAILDSKADESTGSAKKNILRVICIPVLQSDDAIQAVVRLICPATPSDRAQRHPIRGTHPSKGTTDSKSTNTLSMSSVTLSTNADPSILSLIHAELLRPLAELVVSFSSNMMSLQASQASAAAACTVAERVRLEDKLKRVWRINRVIGREVCTLLDAPTSTPPSAATTQAKAAGPGDESECILPGEGTTPTSTMAKANVNPKFSHPASCAPGDALADVLLRLMGMLRSLLRGEGQAVLIRSDDRASAIAFQVMYSGNKLSWAGSAQGSFIPLQYERASVPHSIVLRAVREGKPQILDDVLGDACYDQRIDGIFNGSLKETARAKNNGEKIPCMYMPVRGRGGCVVAVLVSARGSGDVFNADDAMIVEHVASLAAVSLYWCQGVAPMYRKMVRQRRQLNELSGRSYGPYGGSGGGSKGAAAGVVDSEEEEEEEGSDGVPDAKASSKESRSY